MLKEFSDRILRLKLKRDEKEVKIGFLITGIIILLLLANVFYLNFLVIRDNSKPSYSASNTQQDTSLNSQDKTTTTITAAPTEIVKVPQTSHSNQTAKPIYYKDYYLNLGSGYNQSTDWADVPGAIATFDISSYKNIKEARLETTTNVPTANGTISVRLFNKTDGYAVWNSEREVLAETQGSLLISEKLNYSYGPKLYVVQMKSQLGVPANLIQSRVHVIAE